MFRKVFELPAVATTRLRQLNCWVAEREKAVSKFLTWPEQKHFCLVRVVLGFFVLTIWTILAMAQKPTHQVEATTVILPNAAELKRLSQRPLQLPTLHAGGQCPVSKGSREIVPQHHPFGS